MPQYSNPFPMDAFLSQLANRIFPSGVTSLIKISESFPEPVVQAQAMTLPPVCLTMELECLGS